MKTDTYLLNMHTTGENALVNLCLKEVVLATEYNHHFKEHASFLHVAIDKLLNKQNLQPSQLKAIGVTNGPGSYTGIRVGLAAAKGLSFALKIPLIMLNTLEVMAFTAIRHFNDPEALYCPMIDARRMEVYTALFRFDRTEVLESQALILEETLFKKYMEEYKIYFFGNGSHKFKQILSPDQHKAVFEEIEADTHSLAALSNEKFDKNEFSDLAISEPLYLKEFQSTSKK